MPEKTESTRQPSRRTGWRQQSVTLLYLLSVCFIIGCTTLFFPLLEPTHARFLWALLPAAIGVAACVWWQSSGKCERFHLSDKAFWLASTAITALAISGFIVLLLNYEQTYFSDSLIIREQVEALMRNTTCPEHTHYFQMYPNNMGITTLFCFVARLTGSWKTVELLGALLCVLSVWLISLTVRNISSSNILSLFALLFGIFYVGTSIIAVNPYTHNYGIFFVALSLFIYTRPMPFLPKCVLLSLTAAIGYYLKATTLIPLLAIAMMEFRFRSPISLRRIGMAAVCLAVCFGLMVVARRAAWRSVQYEANPRVATSLPYFLALGQNSETCGRVSFRIMHLSEHLERQPVAVRNAAFASDAAHSVAERGLLGNLLFQAQKTAQTWGDGTLDDFRTIYQNGLMQRIGWAFVMARQAANYFLLLLLPVAAFSRRVPRALLLAFVGVFLYLALFEAHPRYLFMFMPILITAAFSSLKFDTCRRA